MPAGATRGHVIFRRWVPNIGLDEQPVTAANLQELFDLCVQTDQPMMVDRVVLEGIDENGAGRVVTLTFQSVTLVDDTPPNSAGLDH